MVANRAVVNRVVEVAGPGVHAAAELSANLLIDVVLAAVEFADVVAVTT